MSCSEPGRSASPSSRSSSAGGLGCGPPTASGARMCPPASRSSPLMRPTQGWPRRPPRERLAYQCLNPPYHRWTELFPPLQDAVVHAARTTSARYVSFENLYLYVDTHGTPLTESTSQLPRTRKGKARLVMAEQLRGLHNAGDLAVTTARASDYFGPRGTSQSPLGDLVIGAALAGKPAGDRRSRPAPQLHLRARRRHKPSPRSAPATTCSARSSTYPTPPPRPPGRSSG